MRIVLFDRSQDRVNTNVYNDRLDVFGSVQFENRMIKNKIKSRDFFNAEIKKVEEIPGITIEDNRYKKEEDRETVIMIGGCVYLDPEDLALAKKDLIND